MALYIFSDAHLGSGSPEKEAEKVKNIRRLVDIVKADGKQLVILGDLFDFWFEYKHAMPKDHHRVLFMFHELVQQGIRIDYVSGNHDFWMDDFFETQLSFNIHQDFYDLEYDNLKLHLIHGDGLAHADRGYRFLKKILRNRLNIWLYRKLPPDWAIPLAKKVSESSRKYTSRRDHTFAPDYRDYAAKKLKDGFQVVAIGHLHIPVCEELNGGTYINTGDFINHYSYAKLKNGKISLEFLK